MSAVPQRVELNPHGMVPLVIRQPLKESNERFGGQIRRAGGSAENRMSLLLVTTPYNPEGSAAPCSFALGKKTMIQLSVAPPVDRAAYSLLCPTASTASAAMCA